MTSPARAPVRAVFALSAFILTAAHIYGATIVAAPGESGLRSAIVSAQSRDTVVVSGYIDLAAPVILTKPVSITKRPDDPNIVVIRGAFEGELFHIVTNQVFFQALTFDGSTKTDGLRVDGEVTLRDCTLTGLRNPVVQTGWYPPDTHVRLERVIVTRNANGLRAHRLEAIDCTFSFNGLAGALATQGLVDKCVFEYNLGYGLVVIHATVRNSVFRYNADFGLMFDPDPGRLVLDACLFYANPGGGILVREEAYATVDNCTFTRHTGRPAVTVTEASSVLFRHCTVVDNLVTHPGTSPWYPDGSAFSADGVELQNCIVAQNPTSLDPDATGMPGSWLDGGGNVIGGNPRLSVLQNHGGATMTLLPLPGSPAIGAGKLSAIVTDARGLSRLAGEAPDAGATELGATAPRDSDADGLPDSWELFHSLAPTESADAASDTDLDGQSALAEFKAHTDPNDPLSVLRFTTTYFHVTDEAQNIRGVALRWTPAPGATYEIEMSTDLREWRRAPGFVFGGYSGLEFSTSVNAPVAFFRLRAE